MGTPMILKIILTDGSSQRFTLPHGLPESVDDLMVEVKEQCGLEGNFRLQFMDSLFGNEFLNLTSISEVENRGTLRIIDVSRPATMQHDGMLDVSETQASSSCAGSDSVSVDTDILSSSDSTCSRSSWPAVFCVPKFSYDAEIKLQRANSAYQNDGTALIPDPKLKSTILEGLVQEIVQYKVYATDKEMEQVAQSLIERHPCLREKGSPTGCCGWKISLKYKLSNYRTQLRKLGCHEVTVNSLKNKPAERRSAAFGVKKPKRAEVNYCPAYPLTETQKSLEDMQKALLLDVKKRNNRETVKFKMEKTFALRRHEVVRDAPMVETVMARWPALFEVSEINAEFKRITTIPLQSKFLSQLDLHSDSLTKLFKKRGGQLGERLKAISAQFADCDDIDAERECIIKGICTYMGEDPANLVQEYEGGDEVAINEAIEDTVVGISILKVEEDEQDIGIILEGIKVLQGVDSVALAVALLFGLMYALNLSYPPNLRYTFETIQKILMELDGGKLSRRALALKNRLFEQRRTSTGNH